MRARDLWAVVRDSKRPIVNGIQFIATDNRLGFLGELNRWPPKLWEREYGRGMGASRVVSWVEHLGLCDIVYGALMLQDDIERP
jgi:hypothetical protein